MFIRVKPRLDSCSQILSVLRNARFQNFASLWFFCSYRETVRTEPIWISSISVRFRQFYFSIKPGSRNWKNPFKSPFWFLSYTQNEKYHAFFSRFHSRLWNLKLVPHFSQIRRSFFRISPRYYSSQFSQVIALFHFSRKSQNKKFVEFFQLFAAFIELEKCRLFSAFFVKPTWLTAVKKRRETQINAVAALMLLQLCCVLRTENSYS